MVLFSIGSIDIGWFEIFLSALLAILLVVVWFVWRFAKKNTMRGAYGVIVSRDVLKFGKLLEEELKGIRDKVSESKSGAVSKDRTEILFRVNKTFDIVGKMEKYLSQEVGGLEK